MPVLTLDGEHLQPDDVLAVARGDVTVQLSPDAKRKVKRSRAVVDKLLEANLPVYGLNTGFGSLRDIHINARQARDLQRNLIRSHCCGVGEPADRDVVRAMMLLRANTLAKGNSGVRPVVIDTLVQMLNKRIHPVVPVKGSVGASGDLAPLSHLALVLIGEGEAFLPNGERVSGGEALRRAGIEPLELEAKEGLALNNGTQFMTAVGVLAFLDAKYLADMAIMATALSLEALQGVRNACDRRVHDARNQRGQKEVAMKLQRLIEGSEILSSPVNFGGLNGACDSLDKAAKLIGEWHPHDPQSTSVLSAIATIQKSLDEKRQSVRHLERLIVKKKSETQPPERHNSDEEATRDAAGRVFEQDLNQVEDVYDQVFILSSKNGMAEARKHLQIALERMQEVVPDSLPVQDDYSFRCAPQVLGAALDTLQHVGDVLALELNAATDNPLIFAPDPPQLRGKSIDAYKKALSLADCRAAVVSGGNFHGQPIALALDQACIAMAAIGNIAERRIFHLTTGRLSNGLPRFLTPHAGLQSGMMIAQVTAASLVSENKTLCHPASADSIPTVEDAEDHVSMGAFAARKFAEVVNNVNWVVAIELICAAQGVRFRRPAKPSPANQILLADVRRLCKELNDDRPLGPNIEEVAGALRRREFRAF